MYLVSSFLNPCIPMKKLESLLQCLLFFLLIKGFSVLSLIKFIFLKKLKTFTKKKFKK